MAELFTAVEAKGITDAACDKYAEIVRIIKDKAANKQYEVLFTNEEVSDEIFTKLREGGFYINRAARGVVIAWDTAVNADDKKEEVVTPDPGKGEDGGQDGNEQGEDQVTE